MGTAEVLSEVLKILANPIRLKILALCSEKERTSRELRKFLGISKPLLIAHLKKLVNAGLINYKIKVSNGKVIKYYKTPKIEICVCEEMLRGILKELEGIVNNQANNNQVNKKVNKNKY